MVAVEKPRDFDDILDLVPTIAKDSHLEDLDRLFPGAAEVARAAREHAERHGATPWEARIRGAAAAAGYGAGLQTLELSESQ